MVKTPVFKIIANGTDVTESIKKNLISLSFSDEANNDADELNITVAGAIARPSYDDKLKLFLGYDETLSFVGVFSVQKTVRTKNHVLSISGTSVNFSTDMKEKRDITYENISLKNICKQIADRNSLNLKSDFDDIYTTSQAQSNESDLHFLNRLANEYNAIFNIKNETLIFTKKIKDEIKNKSLPTYTIDAYDVDDLSIEHSDKTMYKSCKSVWHDTKENKTKSVTVGTGKPVLINKGAFKNAADAKQKAKAKLEKAGQGLIKGSLTIDGEILFAGGKLNLVNTLEDDGEYQVKTVEHTFDSNGWKMTINFER